MSDVTAIPTIIYDVIQQQRALHPDRSVLIGVAGAQGSGFIEIQLLRAAATRGDPSPHAAARIG